MNIKKSSRLYKYLLFLDRTIGTELTSCKSLCPLFWKTLLSTFFLPILLLVVFVFGCVVFVFDKVADKTPEKVKKVIVGIILGVIISFLLFILGFVVWLDPLGLVTVLAVGLTTFGVVTAVTYDFTGNDKSVASFVSNGVKAVKNKYCPIITFEDDEQIRETNA